MTHCKNCETSFEGRFCPECGQKAKTSRISTNVVIRDLRDQLIHFDTGFLFTAKQLLTRPGHAIREYLDGKRVKHIKPVKFVVWATAISFLVVHYLGFQEKLMAQLEKDQTVTKKSHEMGQKVSEFISKYPSVVMFLTIPAIAFVAWLLFRKRRLNYAEHFTMNAYLMGELNLLSIVLSVVMAAIGSTDLYLVSIMAVVQWSLWCVYFGWAYSQFLGQPKKVFAWLKGIFTLLGGYTLLLLIFSSALSLIVFFFKPQIDAWLGN